MPTAEAHYALGHNHSPITLKQMLDATRQSWALKELSDLKLELVGIGTDADQQDCITWPAGQ